MKKSRSEERPPFGQRAFGLIKRLSWKQTFASLQYPNYRLWFWGQLISLFGSWMQITALGFLVYELTKSPAYLGLVGFAAGLPTWLFMLYAGVVADRVPRRRMLIITQTALVVLAFLLAGLTFGNLVEPWHILVLAFGMGVANAFDAPARQAFVLEMVEPEDVSNAIALNSAMFNSAIALGPAVAGVTYALVGPGWCFTFNGISFIAVIIALALMKLRPFIPKTNMNSFLQDFKEGLRYVGSHGMIRTIIVTVGAVTLFGFAFATLMPAWAVEVLGGDSTTNGFLLSARGVGALIGSLLIASLGRFKFRGRLLTLGTLVFPVFVILFAFVRWLPLSLLILVAAGMSNILIYNLCNSLVQSFSPIELRGRVMSIYSFVFFGLMPVAALWIGGAAEKFGEPAAVITGGFVTLLFTLAVFFFVPKLRRLP
jgi:MFS family permease